jgi:hypothetical protein
MLYCTVVVIAFSCGEAREAWRVSPAWFWDLRWRHVPSAGRTESNLRSDLEAVRRHIKNVLRDQAVL